MIEHAAKMFEKNLLLISKQAKKSPRGSNEASKMLAKLARTFGNASTQEELMAALKEQDRIYRELVPPSHRTL